MAWSLVSDFLDVLASLAFKLKVSESLILFSDLQFIQWFQSVKSVQSVQSQVIKYEQSVTGFRMVRGVAIYKPTVLSQKKRIVI